MPASFRQNAVIYFPVTRMLIGVAICLGIGLLGMQGTQLLLRHTAIPQYLDDPIAGTVFAILVIILYAQLYRWYENRFVNEISTRRLPLRLISGIVVGFGLASLVILVQLLTHVYTVLAARTFGPVLPVLWNTFVNAAVAEILIIGIVFRLTEEWLGSYLALAVLVVLFFVLHISAPGATPVSALAVSLHAAFLLAPAYIFTRSLWLPIAIHFAWDFCFAGIYGASINGYIVDTSMFQSQTLGSDFLTGGYFGPQGSIQAAILCLIVGFILLGLGRRKGNIKPFYSRPPSVSK